MSNGKRKGGAYERAICKRLSMWLSEGARDDLFWRSAMSGGRATVQAKKGRSAATQVGDVSAIHPHGAKLTDLFLIELKHYKNLQIESMFLKGKGKLWKFWKRARKDAKACGKFPLLIGRQGGIDIMLLDYKGRVALSDVPTLPLMDWRMHYRSAFLFLLDEILDKVDPRWLKPTTPRPAKERPGVKQGVRTRQKVQSRSRVA